jgi:hypothetical protein
VTFAKISWLDHDESVLRMNPMELLNASALWASQRPADEPWLATTKPTTPTKECFTIALSLDAYHFFVEPVRRAFSQECVLILDECTVEEIQRMKSDELAKGNPGHLCLVEPNLLRLQVPARLLERAKTRVECVFANIEGDLVCSASID